MIVFENIGIGFFSANGRKELIQVLKSINFETLDKNAVINLINRSFKCKKKFDYLLPDTILNKSYEQQYLDFIGTEEFIRTLPI